jgi:hypothetical protein
VSDQDLLGRALAGHLRIRDERRLADLLRQAGWFEGKEWPASLQISENERISRWHLDGPGAATWRDPVTGARSGLWASGAILAERTVRRLGWRIERETESGEAYDRLGFSGVTRFRAPGSRWWVGSIVAARLAFGFAVPTPKKERSRPEPMLVVDAAE